MNNAGFPELEETVRLQKALSTILLYANVITIIYTVNNHEIRLGLLRYVDWWRIVVKFLVKNCLKVKISFEILRKVSLTK